MFLFIFTFYIIFFDILLPIKGLSNGSMSYLFIIAVMFVAP